MIYVYTALLLHKAGQKVTEEAVKKVLEAADVKVDDARVKALIASLEGVNINEAIEKAAVAPAAAPAAQAPAEAPAEAKKEEDKTKKAEEEKQSEEKAAAGLGSLFG